MRRGQLDAARLQRREQGVERVVRLQRAQVGGVRAGDVDRHVVGVRVDAVEARQVVVGGALDRRGGVLADVQAEDAAGAAEAARAPHVGEEGGQPLVVEAEPVDERAGGGQAEHARLRVARLRQRRHRADLDEAEAHRAQAVDGAAVLVEPGGEADAVREAQPGERRRVGHARLRPQALQRRVLQPRQGVERQLVRMLGVEPEQERPHQRVGDERGERRHGRRRRVLGTRRIVPSGPPSAYWRASTHLQRKARHGTHRKGHLRTHQRRQRGAVGCADAALAAPLRDLHRAHAARAGDGAGAGQAQRGGGQQGARRARRRQGRGRHRRRRRGARRAPRHAVPALGVADRLGHAEQHEHERGARQPRLAAHGRAGRRPAPRASERRRQPRPVVQRRVPHRHERGGGAGHRRPPAARAARAARHARRQVRPSSPRW